MPDRDQFINVRRSTQGVTLIRDALVQVVGALILPGAKNVARELQNNGPGTAIRTRNRLHVEEKVLSLARRHAGQAVAFLESSKPHAGPRPTSRMEATRDLR